jgi:hypothetical protein
MKKLSFTKDKVLHQPINHWEFDDTTIAIYQGNRGENKELDFIVKYKEGNKRLRALSHTHWVVDLLIKSNNDKTTIKSFIEDMIEIYDQTIPFSSVEERNNYDLKYFNRIKHKYSTLSNTGNYKIEVIITFIELFCLCEKQTKNAYFFKKLLGFLLDYCNGKKDFYQVISLSKKV